MQAISSSCPVFRQSRRLRVERERDKSPCTCSQASDRVMGESSYPSSTVTLGHGCRVQSLRLHQLELGTHKHSYGAVWCHLFSSLGVRFSPFSLLLSSLPFSSPLSPCSVFRFRFLLFLPFLALATAGNCALVLCAV